MNDYDVVSRIQALGDECIEQMDDEQRKALWKYWPAVLIFINEAIGRQDADDIDALDLLWTEYRKLCARYGILPTLGGFASMTGFDRRLFSKWGKEFRLTSRHKDTVAKWRQDTENAAIERLTNQPLPNPNLIFICKANFGYNENGRRAIEDHYHEPTVVRTAADLPWLGNKKLDTRGSSEP